MTKWKFHSILGKLKHSHFYSPLKMSVGKITFPCFDLSTLDDQAILLKGKEIGAIVWLETTRFQMDIEMVFWLILWTGSWIENGWIVFSWP